MRATKVAFTQFMEKEEIILKQIILKHSDIISIPEEIVISNKFELELGGLTRFDLIVLDIMKYYQEKK